MLNAEHKLHKHLLAEEGNKKSARMARAKLWAKRVVTSLNAHMHREVTVLILVHVLACAQENERAEAKESNQALREYRSAIDWNALQKEKTEDLKG